MGEENQSQAGYTMWVREAKAASPSLLSALARGGRNAKPYEEGCQPAACPPGSPEQNIDKARWERS